MQNRTTVDQRLSLKPDERDALNRLADELGLKKNRTIALALRVLSGMTYDLDKIKALGEQHGWDEAETVGRAVAALEALMAGHQAIADAGKGNDYDGDLYMRIAREAPAQLVEPKGTVEMGWTDPSHEQTAMLLSGWLVYVDADTDELMAVKGRKRGRYVKGEVVAKNAPSTEKAVTKHLASDEARNIFNPN